MSNLQWPSAYQELERDLRQETMAQQEYRAEERAFVFTRFTNQKDYYAPEWQELARKVSSQWTAWLKSEEGPTTETIAMCVNINQIMAKFKDYVLSKHTGSKLQDWETAFASDTFHQSLRLFLSQKAFDAKSELDSQGKTGFVCRLGFVHYHLSRLESSARQQKHEAINRAKRLYGEGCLPDQMMEEISDMIDSRLEPIRREILAVLGAVRFPDQVDWSPPLGDNHRPQLN